MKKLIFIFFIILSFADCKQSNNILSISKVSSKNLDLNYAKKEVNIALLTDLGKVHNSPFSYEIWRGLLRVNRDFGVSVSYFESKNKFQYDKNINIAINSGHNLIIGTGMYIAQDIKKAAIKNPEISFVQFDYSYTNNDKIPNLLTLNFRSEESSFLAGFVAANMSKTKKIGFIGGIKSQAIDRFEYGFKAGIRHRYPRANLNVRYLDSFSNQSKAKSIARQMYRDGVDVIFHASGLAGNGVIEAAKEQDKWVIGVDNDQSYLAPNNVLTSVLKNLKMVSYNVADSFFNNKKFNSTGSLGIAENAVDIVYSKFLTSQLVSQINIIKEKILSGEIVIPTNEQEYNDMF